MTKTGQIKGSDLQKGHKMAIKRQLDQRGSPVVRSTEPLPAAGPSWSFSSPLCFCVDTAQQTPHRSH